MKKDYYCLLFACLFCLTSYKCQDLNSCGKGTLKVYFIPFDNSYYLSINEEKIKTHIDAISFLTKDRSYLKEIIKFYRDSILLATPLTGYTYIDVRVLLDLRKGEDSLIIALDKFGTIKANGIIYERKDSFIRLIEAKFDNIKWPKR